jgi:hypothetical protein
MRKLSSQLSSKFEAVQSDESAWESMSVCRSLATSENCNSHQPSHFRLIGA